MSNIQDRLQALFPAHYRSGNVLLLNADCMEVMKHIRNDEFELSCVDPPYGINVGMMHMGAGSSKRCSKIEGRKWSKKGWDMSQPSDEYFYQLFRVSNNQIIWGGNYFALPPSQYFAIWDKGDGMRGRSFAECEYAWVSSGGTRLVQLNPVDKNRIHPTQKPVKLYDWLLSNYAKPEMKILDTHLGSGSSAIAAHYFGCDLVGCEIDADYYQAAVARFERETAQIDMFGGKS